MIGKTLLHFEITAKLGEGGMGAVYRATDATEPVIIVLGLESRLEPREPAGRFSTHR